MAKCGECGAVIAEDVSFCSYCGAKVNVIDESVGRRILDSSQAILAALASMTPDTTFQVVGRAVEGDLSDGLVLERADGTLWWSDGSAPAPVQPAVPDRLFDAGNLVLDMDWSQRCPRCLASFHKSRAVWTPWDSGWPGVNLASLGTGRYTGFLPLRATDGFFAGLDHNRTMPDDYRRRLASAEGYTLEAMEAIRADYYTDCPMCVAEVLSSADYAGKRWTLAQQAAQEAMPKRGVGIFGRRSFEMDPQVAERFGDKRGGWEQFAERLTSVIGTPASDGSDWRQYQREYTKWGGPVEAALE